jgi:phosphoribosylaminoimidazole-succinocarboxamide synthase
MMNREVNTASNLEEMKHLHEGSVKSIYQYNDSLLFQFSDRYSIYDWGEMPDPIKDKGNCLTFMADLFFRELEKNNIKTHYRGLIHSDKNNYFLKVTPVDKFPPKLINEIWIYDEYSKHPTNSLVPLEVVFRYGVPKGSSLLKRRDDLNEGDTFSTPLIEFSTKLEPTDRYLDEKEALSIAGLSLYELDNLKNTTSSIAQIIQNISRELGLKLWDGKFEFAFSGEYPNRNFKLVDSIGLDELRFTLGDSFPLSKEYLRQCYTDSSWYKDLLQSKKEYGNEWKKKCISQPEPLDSVHLKTFEFIYKAFTNDLAKKIDGEYIFNHNYTLAKLKNRIVQAEKSL